MSLNYNPYTKLQNVGRVIFYVNIFIIILVYELTKNLIVDDFSENKISFILYTSVLIFLIFYENFVERFFLPALMNSKMARSLILGRQFVEGAWVEFVNFPEGSKYGSKALTILKLSFQNGNAKINGENYAENGELIAVFESEFVSFAWPSLKYKLINKPVGVEYDSPVHGFGELQFEEVNNKKPKTYYGFFYLPYLSGMSSIRGDIIGKKFSKAVYHANRSEMKKIVLALLKQGHA